MISEVLSNLVYFPKPSLFCGSVIEDVRILCVGQEFPDYLLPLERL